MLNVSAHIQATAGGVLTFKVGTNKGGTAANGAGSISLPQYVAIAKLGGPKGDPGKDGVNGTPGAKGDPGYFEYALESYTAQTFVSLTSGSWVRLALPVVNNQSTNATDSLRWNADGSVTMLQAGWYTLDCQIQLPAGTAGAGWQFGWWATSDDTTPVGGAAGALYKQEIPAPISSVTPVVSMPYTGYFTANSRVGVSIFNRGATASGGLSRWSIARTGAGPTGPQGTQGIQGIKGDPGDTQYGARIYRSGANQSIPNGVSTAVIFDTARFDTSAYWSSGTPTRITIPTSGQYMVGGVLSFAPVAGGGYIRQAWIRINGGQALAWSSTPPIGSATHENRLVLSALAYLTAGDYIELFCYHDQGAALGVSTEQPHTSPEMWIARIGAGPQGLKGDTGPVGPASNTNVPVATILTTAVPKTGDYTSAPGGFLFCDGTPVSRATYAALFSAIGTTYGAGDGSTTFNLPDLLGRFALGAGTPGTPAVQGGVAHVLGSKGGEEQHVLTGPESGIAQHKHTISGSTGSGGTHAHQMQHSGLSAAGPGAYGWTTPSANSGSYWGDTQGAPDHTHGVGTLVNANTGPTNAAEDHQNMPPFTTVNYMIKY